MDTREKDVFKDFESKLLKNGRCLAETLYSDWQHLGLNQEKCFDRIGKLNCIISKFFDEILEETKCKLSDLKETIKGLEEESFILGRYLSLNIDLTDCGIDQPLYKRRDMLEEKLHIYRLQVSERKIEINRLREWQEEICRSLGVTPTGIREEPLLSEAEVSKLKARLELLQKERNKRFESFLFKKEDIRRLMADLNMAASNDFERRLLLGEPTQFVLTDDNMGRMTNIHDTLASKLQQLKDMVMELREQLHILWERLEEDSIYRTNFLEANPGHSPATIGALRQEITRCEEKKRENLKIFVAKLRTEITMMWEKCLFGAEEKAAFLEFKSQTFTEVLLDIHEDYFRGLQHFYEENSNIFKLNTERRFLWLKMQEIEARGAEPSRLNNRGGQLLKEERERKAIANKLPKIEKELSLLIKAYNEKMGKEFTDNGKPLMEIIEEQWENRKQERQQKLSARKHQGGLATGASQSQKLSPLGKRNRTCKVTPVPTKKALTVSSADRAHIAVDNSALVKRAAVTSIKRRPGSPKRAPRGDNTKARLGPRRKLHLSSEQHEVNDEKNAGPADMIFKTPIIRVNGNTLKGKKRLSGKLKANRRRSLRRSKSSDQVETCDEEEVNVQEKVEPDSTTMTSYSEFQEHLNENTASRSSVAPERVLRRNVINASPAKPPRGKENRAVELHITPMKNKTRYDLPEAAVTPRSRLHISNAFGITPDDRRFTRANTQVIMKTPTGNTPHIDTLATPRAKPIDKNAKNYSFMPLRRQNTVTLFSPAQSSKPLQRSSSSHNLGGRFAEPNNRIAVGAPSPNKRAAKLQLAKDLPVLI